MVPKPVQPGAQNYHLKVFSLIYRYNFAFKCTEPVAGPVQASCPSFVPPVSDVVVGRSAQIHVGMYVYARASGFSSRLEPYGRSRLPAACFVQRVVL